MRIIFIIIVLSLSYGICLAQDDLPVISADRPGALTGTDIMPRFKLQWETGMGVESDSDAPYTITLNSSLLRFGLFERAELRVGTDFLLSNIGKSMKPGFDVAPISVGLKTNLHEGSGIIPSIAFLTEMRTPHMGMKVLLPAHLAPSFHLLFENPLNDRLSLGYNVGAEWDGETATPTTLLGLGVYYDLSERIGTFAETYNYFHPVENDQYLTEFGFTWLLSRRVQADIAADLDLRNLGQYCLITFGIAWLIN
ncbi:MAG: transporter [Bacteroidales bacterium]|nr:transporter [Bacteroidales bacterium]